MLHKNICWIFFVHLTFFMEVWSRALHHSHHRHKLIAGCSRCSPGYAVVERCTKNKNTQCSTCRPGSYLPHHTYKERCYPCSRCGGGLYIAHPCTTTRDTICDSCHTYRGPHNKDFKHKCVLLQNKTHHKSTDWTSRLFNVTIPQYQKFSSPDITSSILENREKYHLVNSQNSLNTLPVALSETAGITKNISKDGSLSVEEEKLSPFQPSTNTTWKEHVDEKLLRKVSTTQAILFTFSLVTAVTVVAVGTVFILRRRRRARPQYSYVAVYSQEAPVL